MTSEIVRALRVVEFIGSREFIDWQMQHSSWSERRLREGVIKAAWIGITPGPVSPEVEAEEAHRQSVERRRDAAMDFINAVASGGFTSEVTLEYLRARALDIQEAL